MKRKLRWKAERQDIYTIRLGSTAKQMSPPRLHRRVYQKGSESYLRGMEAGIPLTTSCEQEFGG